MTDQIEWYEHHGDTVAVKPEYRGKHREICLCYTCMNFLPEEDERHCQLAADLYAFCKKHGGTAIRQECPAFQERGPVWHESDD